MSNDTSGPAFPVQDASAWQCHGMTLRDYFAAKAMQGALACPAFICTATAEESASEFCARMAYDFADAMLAARSKP